MAKHISSLWVGITGNIGGLAKSFSSALAPITAVTRGLKRATGAIAGIAGKALALTGIGSAIAGILGGGLLFKDQLEAIDATAKLADRLGITTEALSSMEHAASLAGVSNEQLAGGFEKMLKNVSEAAAGTGEAGKAFTALGLDAKALIQQSPDEAFRQISEALKNVKNPADRAAAAMDIFGKAGQTLLPLMMQGAAGIKAAQEEAAKLGLTFNRIDAGKVEAANDAITRMKAVVTGAFRTIVIAVAPAILTASDYIRAFAIRTREIIGGLVPTFLNIGSMLWSAVKVVFEGIYSIVAPIFSAVAGFIANNWMKILTGTVAVGVAIWTYLTEIWGNIVAGAQSLWSFVTTVWAAGSNFILGYTLGAGATIGDVFRGIIGRGEYLAQKVFQAFQIAGYAIGHFKDVIALEGVTISLFFVRLANQATYFFGDVIPTIVGWFARNWKEIFTDLFHFSTTVFSNLAQNVVNIISNIGGLLSGKLSFGDLWTPLTDGFKATLSELPQIADRQAGALETSLQATQDALALSLVNGVTDTMNAQAKQADAVAKGIVSTVADAFKPANQPPIAPQIAPPKIPPVTIGASIDPDTLKVAVKPEIKTASAIFAGSAESQALRFSAGRAPIVIPSAASPELKSVGGDLAKKTLTEQTKQTSLLGQIVNKIGGGGDLAIASF